MSERYPFSGDKTLLSHHPVETSIVWTEDNQNNIGLDYSNVTDTEVTLTETMDESYVTAVEDNTTQYLSVLETTNDISYECLQNLTLGNKMETIDFENVSEETIENSDLDLNNQHMVVFSIDGSDDLYGIQIAQDDKGNIQKYQFKFRTNEDGQLEPIPESIQLLPNDDVENVEETEVCSEVEDRPGELKIFVTDENSSNNVLENYEISQEPTEESDETQQLIFNNFPDEQVDGNEVEDHVQYEELEEEVEESEELKVSVDSKEGLIEHVKNSKSTSIKKEILNEESQNSEQFNNLYCETVERTTRQSEITVEYNTFEDAIINKITNKSSIKQEHLTTDKHHFEEIFVEENHEVPADSSLETNEDDSDNQETNPANDSDNEDYEIVEGLHITGDLENESESTLVMHEPETVLQEVLEKTTQENVNNLHSIGNQKDKPKQKQMVYVIVSPPEKENVNSMQTVYQVRHNPRSLLKSSQKPEIPLHVEEDIKTNKRFARNKQAIQARQFHNFISKTTILHAPVRRERLPRKQKIKPVHERVDEEIIVKEVMINSNGFVEDMEKRRLLEPQYLELIELTDSDDDANKEIKSRKSESRRKTRSQVEYSDSTDEESDISIIEIDSDDDEEAKQSSPKRGRGRPRKSSVTLPPAPVETVVSSQKRRRGRPPKSNLDSEEIPLKKSRSEDSDECVKKEIKCPHCPKTFPSENSLNTHIQHHNLENSLRNQKSQPQKPVFEYKHKCNDCNQIFKNTILLGRHECGKKSTVNKCNLCKKIFKSLAELNLHKKQHNKEQMVKNTCTVLISPKKFITKASTSTSTTMYKCKHCPKVCVTQTELKRHNNIHKVHVCTSCSAAFHSRILLNAHVRQSCVKFKQPQMRRLSFRTRPFASPRRSLRALVPTRKSFIAPSRPTKTLIVPVPCPDCTWKASTDTELLKHKVQKHGFVTPDKRPVTKSHKSVPTCHSGIPSNPKLTMVHKKMKNDLRKCMDELI